MPNAVGTRMSPDTTAMAVASALVSTQDYLNQLSKLLVSSKSFTYKTARNTADELRYTWVHTTSKAMKADIQQIIDNVAAQHIKELQPLLDDIKAHGTIMPKGFSLDALFNTKWNDNTWTAIDASRAQWHSLSESLWNISGDAQRQALSLIEQASRDGIPYTKLKHDLSTLLTENGRANMDYNMRRLWTTELRRNRFVAEQSTWQYMGIVQEMILSRSADADVECEICGDAIGYGAMDEKVVPVDYGDIPPYHPWCKCEMRPKETKPSDVKAWLDKQFGTNPVPLNVPVIPVTSAVAPAITTKAPTAKELAQAIVDANRENNMRDFDMQLDKLVKECKQGYRWTDTKTQKLLTRMHANLDHTMAEYGCPKWNVVRSSSYGKAYYTPVLKTITVDVQYLSPDTLAYIVQHEYGHYLQSCLEDYSICKPLWMDKAAYKAGQTALRDAVNAINKYSFRSIENGMSHINYNAQSVSGAPDNVEHLKKAYGELLQSQIAIAELPEEFDAGVWDLTKGYVGTGNTHHDESYLSASWYSTVKNARSGPVQQECVNELTGSYVRGSGALRAEMDRICYAEVPDLWTGLHGWIDLLLGAH